MAWQHRKAIHHLFYELLPLEIPKLAVKQSAYKRDAANMPLKISSREILNSATFIARQRLKDKVAIGIVGSSVDCNKAQSQLA